MSYLLRSLAGSAVFVSLVLFGRIDVQDAALAAIGVTFLLRFLSIRFAWQSPRWSGTIVKNERDNFVTGRKPVMSKNTFMKDRGF